MIRSRKSFAGFTLVEMLVATTVLILLLVMALGAVNNVSTLSTLVTQRIDVNRVARESLDQMGREISEAAVPWNRSNTVNSAQFLIDPPHTLPSGAVTNSDSIFWQSPVAHNTDFGNFAVIGYFVISDTSSPDSSKWRLQLRRVYIEPETSGSAVNPLYQLYTGTNLSGSSSGNNWISGTTSSVFAPTSATADTGNGLQGWEADGVVAMWVRCLDKSGNPIAPTTSSTFNSSVGYISSNTSSYDPYNYPVAYTGTATISGWAAYPNGYTAMPAYVEVALYCVSPGEMARIRSLPAVPPTDAVDFVSGTTFTNYMQQFQSQNPGVKSAQVFSRRFRIYNSD